MATPPKIIDMDYIQFLLAATTAFTCAEAARCSAEPEETPAHDAYSRLLTRRPPDTKALWEKVQPFIEKQTGVLVLDESTLDKPYARHRDLHVSHWSGKHKPTVPGINLITLLWTDGGARLPIDCRVYDKPIRWQNGTFGQDQDIDPMLIDQPCYGGGQRLTREIPKQKCQHEQLRYPSATRTKYDLKSSGYPFRPVRAMPWM